MVDPDVMVKLAEIASPQEVASNVKQHPNAAFAALNEEN